MRQMLCAVVVTLCAFSVATTDEFRVVLKITEEGKATFRKAPVFGKSAKKAEPGEEVTLPLAPGVKFARGVFDAEKKSFAAGAALSPDAALKLLERAGARGLLAQIITDADNRHIMEIRLFPSLKGKKGLGGTPPVPRTVAEEFRATVVKIADRNVTFRKVGKKGDPPTEDTTLPLANDARFFKGVYDSTAKTYNAGDPLDVAAVMKTLEEAGRVFAYLVIASDRTILEMRVVTPKKKKA